MKITFEQDDREAVFNLPDDVDCSDFIETLYSLAVFATFNKELVIEEMREFSTEKTNSCNNSCESVSAQGHYPGA